MLPGHEDVVEAPPRVGLVEPRRERIVEDAACDVSVEAAGVDAKTWRRAGHDHRDRVALVALDERRDVTDEESQSAMTADVAIICALRTMTPSSRSSATPAERTAPPGRGPASTGNLGRHDRVGYVEVVVADTPVEGLEVPGVAVLARGEHVAGADHRDQHARHVGRRAAHQPERRPRPERVHPPPPCEIVGRAGDQPHRRVTGAALLVEEADAVVS